MTKAQARKRLIEAHAKMLKIFSQQPAGAMYMTTKDLDDLLRIVNRINGRLNK